VSEQLIDLLKLGLLAFLYLFFLRVIWAVWTELRTPAVEPRLVSVGADTKPAKPKRSKATAKRQPALLQSLQITEPQDAAGAEYALGPEMTIGRAPGCAIVIDDTYVSQVHARVFADSEGYKLEDLGSTNGTYCNGAPVGAAQLLRRGDRIQIGGVVMEAS